MKIIKMKKNILLILLTAIHLFCSSQIQPKYINGSGTINTMPKFIGSTKLGNSNIIDSTLKTTFTAPLNVFPELEANRVIFLGSSNELESSIVTGTELSLLSGVTGTITTTTATQTLTNKYIDGGTASTPTVGSNDNSIATTSFVASRSSTITSTIAQQTTTLATATAVLTLSASAAISSTYIVRGHLRISCNNTGGVKIGVNFPTGSTCSIEAAGRLSSTTTMANNLLVSSGVLASQAYNTVNSTSGNILIDGFIITSGTSGTIEFIFASANAGETSSIVNGYIEFIKAN